MKIMLSALLNVTRGEEEAAGTRIKYATALGFGLIHGLAFANNFRVILFEDSVIVPLLLFNLGIEVGQIVIVMVLMGALWLYSKLADGSHSKWNQFLSGASFGVAAIRMLEALSRPETTQAPMF